MPTLGLPPGLSESSPLGRLLLQIGELIGQERFAEAIPLMQEAVALQPNVGRLHADLGGLYVETGQHAQAVAPLLRALNINPNIGIAHWRLGIALQALSDPHGAIAALERAVEIRPDLTDALFRLALLYKDQGRRDEALESLRRAADSVTEPAEKQFMNAQALVWEGRAHEAEPLLRTALFLQPDLLAAHGLLARILTASGRFTEAGVHYKAQIAKSPRSGHGYYDFARTRRITAADEGILAQIDSAVEDPRTDDLNRSLMLLARGRVLGALGRYEEAMKALDRASELRSRAFSIDVGQFERKVEEIVTLFSADTISRSTSECSDRTPLLILGMPRSGTTLVEQIVCSHPDITGGGELCFWRDHLELLLEAEGRSLTRSFVESTGAECLKMLNRIAENADRVTDKDPFNFLAIGLIHMAFPRAAIIHCKRYPVDTALSIHQTHFSKSTGLPSGGDDLVRYYRAYSRLMAHWRTVLPEGRLYEVAYERLTEWPRSEIPRLIEHIGVPWNDACLAPHVNTRTVDTPSGWQVRQEINTDAVGRWRRYESCLGPLAELHENGDRSAMAETTHLKSGTSG